MHRTCRMIVWCVEGGEVEVSGFNLGTFGHRETHRGKEAFDTLQAAGHWMQTTTRHTTSRQGDVECFFGQTGSEMFFFQCIPPGVDGSFYLGLDLVDLAAGFLALFYRR